MKAYEHIDKTAGQVFNIGGGAAHTLSLIELIEMLEAMTLRKAETTVTDWRPGDQRYYCTNTAKAKRVFDWQPIVSPEEGVQRILEWLGKRELGRDVESAFPGTISR